MIISRRAFNLKYENQFVRQANWPDSFAKIAKITQEIDKIKWLLVGSPFIMLAFLQSSPSLAAPADGWITPGEAAEKVGEQATVCGKVANTYYSCFVSKKTTFINFGKPYPDHVFSVAIMGEDRGNFGDCPEKLFVDRQVCVSGLIESYDGKPLMKVKDQTQVEWQD